MKTFFRVVSLIALLSGSSYELFAAGLNPTHPNTSTKKDQWFKLHFNREELPFTSSITPIKYQNHYDNALSETSQLTSNEKNTKDPELSSTDTIAIVAIVFAFAATLTQIIFSKKEEMDKLALEIWNQHINSYSEYGNIMDDLRNPSTMTEPKFIQIQQFRNWANAVVLLDKSWMLSTRMLRALGMEKMLLDFMTELKNASVAIDASSDPEVSKFSTYIEQEITDSTHIEKWLEKFRSK